MLPNNAFEFFLQILLALSDTSYSSLLAAKTSYTNLSVFFFFFGSLDKTL